MKHGRLTWFAPDELDAEARALYDRIAGGPRAQGPQAFPLTDDAGRLNGPFNSMLLSPPVGSALQELGAAIRYRTALSDRAREIAILELAAVRRSEFEWYAHERVGRAAGLREEELDALRTGAAAPTFDATESLVRTIAHACAVERDVPDDLFERGERELGARALMDLITLIGYYDLLALNLKLWRTPLPAGTNPVFTHESKG